jgi:hypothetical protein
MNNDFSHDTNGSGTMGVEYKGQRITITANGTFDDQGRNDMVARVLGRGPGGLSFGGGVRDRSGCGCECVSLC